MNLWDSSQVPVPTASSGFDHLIVLIKAPRLIQLAKGNRLRQQEEKAIAPSLWDQGQTPHYITCKACAFKFSVT